MGRHVLIPLLATAMLAGVTMAVDAADAVVVEGSIRARETIHLDHDFDAGAGSPNNYATLRTRVGLAATVGEYASAFVQLQDSRIFGEPRDTLTPLDRVDLHQGYIHIHNAFNASLEFKIGRQEMAYGRHRQIGSQDWSDTGRSFDGLLAMYDIEDVGWLHAFAMKTSETGVRRAGDEPSDAGDVRPESAFLGTYLRLDVTAEAVAEAYLLDLYEDFPAVLDDDGQQVLDAQAHRFTVGGRWRWRGEGSTPASFHAEAALQFGSGPETVATDTLGAALDPVERVEARDIAAYAFTVSGRLGLGGPGAWVAAQVDVASGDGSPTDVRDDTYRQLFPTSHRVLGALDFVGWQNVVAWRATLGAAPWRNWELSASHSFFRLAEPADTWYGADGQPFDDALTGDGGFDPDLARELDLRVAYSPEPDLSFELVAGIWWPGAWQEQATTFAGGADLRTAIESPGALDPASSLFLSTRVAW